MLLTRLYSTNNKARQAATANTTPMGNKETHISLVEATETRNHTTRDQNRSITAAADTMTKRLPAELEATVSKFLGQVRYLSITL